MKKIFLFLTSLVLVLTLMFSSMPVANAAQDGADIPVIHISGQGAQLIKFNEDGVKQTIFPLQISDGYIEEKAKEFLPVFAKAFFTQKWSEFSETLVDILVPVFEPIALDKNGEASDGSRADWTWSRETLRNYRNKDGKYSATAYKFYYDFRVDPMKTADLLHKYIEDVLYVTGEEKVALYGRCLGSNIVAAYMYKYDGEYVQDVIHYASSVYGATPCSKAFTGEMFLDADSLDRFMYDYDLGLGEQYTALLQSFVTLFNKTYGLDITCLAVNNVLEDIYLDIFPEVLRSSYATFPSYWGMVSIGDYEKAMETVFYGADKSEYAGLIEKIEYYRNNVQLRFEDIVKAQEEKGIEFSNIVKYGFQSIPIKADSESLSDQIVTVYESSFGATTAKLDETLSEDYIANAEKNSTLKYISPDKQIDSSTCLSPDTTWYIKNLEHNYFPECLNGLVSQIVNNRDYTVFTSEEYPQYLVFNYESQTISPMTVENYDTTQRWYVTLLDALRTLFENLFKIIREAFA